MAVRRRSRDPGWVHAQLPTSRGLARVLVVDDQPQFVALLHALVGTTSGFEVVGEATSGRLALEAVGRLRPDLVLMDVRMPGLSGIETADLIKAEWPETCVVLVSTTYVDELPRAADHCRADDVIWKGDLRPVLLERLWLRHRARA
jgi:DNA-binding NarL/FixJ family response regulator